MNAQQQKARNNIFGSVLTAEAPSSNYRGGVEGNLNVLQKLRYEDGEHTIFSAESIRNRLRDMLREDGFLSNRSRLTSQGQLTVRYESYPNPLMYIDDLLFGFLALNKPNDLKSVEEKLKPKSTRKGNKTGDSSDDSKKELSDEEKNALQEQLKQIKAFPEFQRDSILRINYAVSLKPFKHDKSLHQSPMLVGAFKNSDSSAITQREVHVSPYQYPFGLNLNDLLVPDHIYKSLNLKEQQKQEYEQNAKLWTAALLRAIGELNGVGGNHARAMFPFSPVSIVLRLTSRRTPDFDIYGFKTSHSELLDDLLHNRLPRDEFYFGGNIVKKMDDEIKTALTQGDKPVKLFEMSKDAIDTLISDAELEA
jgi:CRISPR-associated protein Cst2